MSDYKNNYNDFSFESLSENIKICISDEHRFGTDAFLLADFAGPRHKDSICDFCTGSGIVALLMQRDFQPKHIDTVEIQEKAFEQLKLSLEKSGISNITPFLCDLKEYTAEKPLDLITCNPPYKISGTGEKNNSKEISIARHEMLCTIDDVCKAASRNLKFGGRLCVCNRPERLSDIFIAMKANGIEPKRLRTVHKNPNCPPWLILAEGKKGAKPFLNIEKPLFIQDGKGGYSQEMRRIYKLNQE